MPERSMSWKRAIGEFVIIVLGVLVALGIDEAWASHKDRRSEESYLRALEAALVFDSTELSNTLRSQVLGLVNSEAVLPILEDPGATPGDTTWFVGAVYRSTRWNIPYLQTDTYEDLVSTGRLSLLRSADLRARILDYYRETTWAVFENWPVEYQNAARGAMPPSLLQKLFADCGVAETGSGCQRALDLGGFDTKTAVRRIRATPSIDFNLRLIIDRFGFAARVLERKSRDTAELLQRVRSELERL